MLVPLPRTNLRFVVIIYPLNSFVSCRLGIHIGKQECVNIQFVNDIPLP